MIVFCYLQVRPTESAMDVRHPTPAPPSQSSMDFRHPSPSPMTPMFKKSPLVRTMSPGSAKVHPENSNLSGNLSPALSTSKVHPQIDRDSPSSSGNSTPSFRASRNNGQVNRAFDSAESPLLDGQRPKSAALSISDLNEQSEISHA